MSGDYLSILDEDTGRILLCTVCDLVAFVMTLTLSVAFCNEKHGCRSIQVQLLYINIAYRMFQCFHFNLKRESAMNCG